MKIQIGLASVVAGAMLGATVGLLIYGAAVAEEKNTDNGTDSESAKPASNRETLLRELAEQDGYRLEPGQILHRVAPPLPERRAKYYRLGQSSQADAMTFHWDGKRLSNWGMTFGSDYTLTGVLDAVQQIKSQEIEGPPELLDRKLPGDWVVRPGGSDDEVVRALEAILRNEFQLQVRLEFRKRVRWVYVARGKYKYTPLKERAGFEKGNSENQESRSDGIDVFGKEIVAYGGAGGGSGDLKECLQWVGRWIEMPIVNEVDEPSKRSLHWQLYERPKSTKAERQEDHDPELVLKNIAAQTGLTFTKEIRPIRRLMVEPIE